MGGGVSFGSFSGSSLTEALKLFILYGKDENGNPNDIVVVDGINGASGGAIALTIMLTSLIDYKSMMPLQDTELSVADLKMKYSKTIFKVPGSPILVLKTY